MLRDIAGADTLRRLRARATPVAMVVFDCDGVLIDSEPICDRVVARELATLGWRLTPEACHARFLGLTFYDMVPLVEAELGRSVGDGWVAHIVGQVTEAMAREAVAMPGARAALEAVSALGLPWRVASNSSHAEMAAKFARAGLDDLVAGRVHSAYDVIAAGGRGKPAPDLFQAAAAAEHAPPSACLVIEDSVPGAQAARSAGMACLGFSPGGDGASLAAEGALLFRHLDQLPRLLRAASGADA